MNGTKERSILFSPLKVGTAEIPNRFVRSATHEFLAGKDGRMTERHRDLYRALAEGGVGLIITGHAYVNRAGIASPGQTAADDDRLIELFRPVPEAVHGTPSKIFLQIAHAGRQTKERLTGGVPLAPSAVPDPVSKVTPREMTEGEIHGLVRDFIQAARRAAAAGFDGVQIHAAHGYLLSGFLSPHTNRRTDAWGGSTENRARVVVEILAGIRAELGRKFPVIMKINASDFLPSGLEPEEAIAVARRLEPLGLDGVEVSGGMAARRAAARSGRGSGPRTRRVISSGTPPGSKPP